MNTRRWKAVVIALFAHIAVFLHGAIYDWLAYHDYPRGDIIGRLLDIFKYWDRNESTLYLIINYGLLISIPLLLWAFVLPMVVPPIRHIIYVLNNRSVDSELERGYALYSKGILDKEEWETRKTEIKAKYKRTS